MDLSEFQIIPFSDNLQFEAKDYVDTGGIRQYFTSNGQNEDIIPKYESMDDMLDFYSAVIGKARNSDSLIYQCRNIHKELPVPLSSVCEYFCDAREIDEPPFKLIVQIAENDFSILQLLLHSPRKVLRRNQQLVPIGRIQQIDGYCMRWLARQPGYTAAEKGGSRQRLMGVVRYESMDTLENRVLKQYMVYCMNEGRRYISKYEKSYLGSSRIRIVKSFVSLIKMGLSMPEFNEVRNLYEIPKPNYTLQNNKLYHTIWQNYLILARHISEIELAWRYRHRILYEITKIISMAVIDMSIRKDGNIIHEIWMSPYPSKDGVFCSDKEYAYFDCCRETGKSFRVMDNDGFIEFQYKNFGQNTSTLMNVRRNIRCFFIPDCIETENFSVDSKGLSIIYAENGIGAAEDKFIKFIGQNQDTDIVSDIFNAVSDYYGVMDL